jgi:hypothetical protein
LHRLQIQPFCQFPEWLSGIVRRQIKPLIEHIIRIVFPLQLPETFGIFSIHNLIRLIAPRKIDIPAMSQVSQKSVTKNPEPGFKPLRAQQGKDASD